MGILGAFFWETSPHVLLAPTDPAPPACGCCYLYVSSSRCCLISGIQSSSAENLLCPAKRSRISLVTGPPGGLRQSPHSLGAALKLEASPQCLWYPCCKTWSLYSISKPLYPFHEGTGLGKQCLKRHFRKGDPNFQKGENCWETFSEFEKGEGRTQFQEAALPSSAPVLPTLLPLIPFLIFKEDKRLSLLFYHKFCKPRLNLILPLSGFRLRSWMYEVHCASLPTLLK